MISNISPTNPVNPSGDARRDTPDVSAAAKKLAAQLDTATAEFSNLDLKTLEPKLNQVAHLITTLCAMAKQGLQAAGK
ncbi:MAG TPA: hypothetical protein VHK67_05490 [Rhabdochlamydiaceae bacterium]|jgi:hypothetical protein|nr:hypothetical protein [Rhabdochlamydiaceae bacterium]